MKKKSRRKPGYVTHNRYELLLMNIKATIQPPLLQIPSTGKAG